MATIKTLPDDVARQIAAGEVVERPASVVKELLENSIDAGARAIHIRTSGAGSDLVEIRDDGCGMSPEDVARAPQNFSTSKISRAEDLQRIGTFGFRGEALASISAVSRFEIVSSDNDRGEGWALALEGKSTRRNEPAPHEQGTTVRVRDLFFNTPARKRFLKSALTERKRMLETILAVALISPDLEIHYVDDDRHILDLLPSANWRDRVAAVLGATTMKHMVETEGERGDMRLGGFVSLPSFTRGNRNHQFFFINRRPVREKTLLHALHDAYRSVIPYKRFPIAVLSLQLPSEEVDVNVHPTKLEVRVRNERALFEVVRSAVKRSMSAHSEARMSVGMNMTESSQGTEKPVYTSAPDSSGKPAAGSAELFPPAGANADSNVISLHERVRDNKSAYGNGGHNPSLSLRAGEEPNEAKEAVETWRDKSVAEEGLFWQFNKTYIFIQVRGGVVVIDQHAAHERVIFDTSMRQMENQAPPSQQILFHIHLELSLRELEVFKSSQHIFQKLGFDLEPFGGKSILVRGYPQGLKNWDEGRMLLQIFDDILEERYPGDTLTDQVVASFACRSAIKAGKELSREEMKLLADQLFAVENPYSCPHGRPTIHRLSLEEIEKWFHRR